MGAVSIDIHKKERLMETKYALNTAEGVQLLFADIPYLEERRYVQGDYAASDVLMDIETALEKAKTAKKLGDRLTDRQCQALNLIYIQGYIYEEVSEIMNCTMSTVYEHCEKAAEKIAKVFSDWNYNELSVIKLTEGSVE